MELPWLQGEQQWTVSIDNWTTIICLHETFRKSSYKLMIKNHEQCDYIHDTGLRTSGGISILIRKNVPQSKINIHTYLQAIVVSVTLHKTWPAGWGCRIHWLRLCRGVRPLNEAICWPWVATCKALGWNPGSWAVIDLVTEWSMVCNIPLWPLLGLTGGWIGLIWSIGWSCQALAPMFYPNHTFESALAANSQPLSVRC